MKDEVNGLLKRFPESVLKGRGMFFTRKMQCIELLIQEEVEHRTLFNIIN